MEILRLNLTALLLAVILCFQVPILSAHQHAPSLDREALLQGFGWDVDAAEITIEQIADGLYVLFGLGGNIAVSIGPDGVLIVDDQLPELADRIISAIEDIGGGARRRLLSLLKGNTALRGPALPASLPALPEKHARTSSN